MAERTCGWCGADITGMSARALYCTQQHKKNAGSKRHRARNPGYYKRYNGTPARIAYKERNRDRLRAYAREQQRQYRIDHPNAGRAWWAANAERHRLYQATRRARKLSTACLVTERDIQRLLARHRFACAYCGETGRLDIDHVVPLKRGGRHAIGNLLPACRTCNASKNARFLAAWRWGR